MHVDTKFAALARDAVAAIPAPAAPVSNILSRAAQPERVSPRRFSVLAKYAIAAAAAMVLVSLSLPFAAPSLAQTIEAKIQALLGWTPPPPAPRSVTDAMKARAVTLDEARSLVNFELQPPVGLPGDVVAHTIYAAPSGVYDNATHKWHVGAVTLSFVYRRTGNRFFTVAIGRFDPSSPAPAKYIYDADDTGANGLPKRFENFAWRNGDQVTQIVAEQLDAVQIGAIRTAMGGIPIKSASRAALNSREIIKLRVGPPPP
jgi:hypothetical protein